MRNSVFLILVLALQLMGCGRQTDADVRKIFQGNWVVEDNDKYGNAFKSSITVDPSGNYTCHILNFGSSNNLPREENLAGNFCITNGIMTDTMTKHDNTNAVLPMVSRARILHAEKNQIVVKWEGESFPTYPVVFRRESN